VLGVQAIRATLVASFYPSRSPDEFLSTFKRNTLTINCLVLFCVFYFNFLPNLAKAKKAIDFVFYFVLNNS
jgi:hypothetical protein